MEVFLNQIGINEDYLTYFEESNVEEVKVSKETNRFHFFIKVKQPLPYPVYQDLFTSLKEAFHHEIKLTLISSQNTYQEINPYIKEIIKEYANVSMRYNVFLDREAKINEEKVEYPVYNKIEELNLKNIERELINKLKEYGFANLDFNIILEEHKDQELLDRINQEKDTSAMKNIPTPKTPSHEKEEVSPQTQDKKTFYRPKKSTEVTKIKDLLYETDNVNIEVQIFGVDLFEAKSGYKIFTLKVTDFSDSMYAKIFTKDEEEFKRLKDLLKAGSWYSMYGRVKEDNFANNELVFMTRFRDVTPIDAKLDWVRTDKSPEKRVELHAHTMMSQMDGVIDEIKLVKTAIKWGHRAIAITDHDGCQAFPHVFNEVTGYNKKILSPYKDKLKE